MGKEKTYCLNMVDLDFSDSEMDMDLEMENLDAFLLFDIPPKKSQKSQKEIIQSDFIKVLATLFNIIRQKCAGCQVTYLPKIDALLLQKIFQTF